jgi:hypothetical protein
LIVDSGGQQPLTTGPDDVISEESYGHISPNGTTWPTQDASAAPTDAPAHIPPTHERNSSSETTAKRATANLVTSEAETTSSTRRSAAKKNSRNKNQQARSKCGDEDQLEDVINKEAHSGEQSTSTCSLVESANYDPTKHQQTLSEESLNKSCNRPGGARPFAQRNKEAHDVGE